MSAQEGADAGFVNRLAPPAELDSVVESFAQELAAKSPLILELGRRSFYRALGMQPDDALDYLQSMLSLTLSSEDTAEGLAAFRDKRQPLWRGR
jgi:enoyl-CoA hydratase/carnithine racemase